MRIFTNSLVQYSTQKLNQEQSDVNLLKSSLNRSLSSLNITNPISQLKIPSIKNLLVHDKKKLEALYKFYETYNL